MKSFTLTLENMIDAKFYNSQSATALPAKDRKITLDCQVPYTSENADLYNQGVAGGNATLAVSYASSTLLFTLGGSAGTAPGAHDSRPRRDFAADQRRSSFRGPGHRRLRPSLIVTLPA